MAAEPEGRSLKNAALGRKMPFVDGHQTPNVAKVGVLKSQGVEGDDGVGYCPPEAEQHRIWSPPAFPRCFRANKMAKSTPSIEFTSGGVVKAGSSFKFSA